MIDQFKALADSVQEDISAFKNDAEKVSAHIGINTEHGFSHANITDRLYELIKMQFQLSEKPANGFYNLKALEKALVYEAVLDGNDNKPYLIIFQVIRDAGGIFIPFDNADRWKEAIRQAKNYASFTNKEIFVINDLRDVYPKAYDQAMAARELRELGCTVAINGFLLEIEGLDTVIDEIVKLIKESGASM